MPKYCYVPASETVYITPEDIQNMIGAALKVRKETRLQRLIESTVEIEVLHIFKKANDKVLNGTYIKLYQLSSNPLQRKYPVK